MEPTERCCPVWGLAWGQESFCRAPLYPNPLPCSALPHWHPSDGDRWQELLRLRSPVGLHNNRRGSSWPLAVASPAPQYCDWSSAFWRQLNWDKSLTLLQRMQLARHSLGRCCTFLLNRQFTLLVPTNTATTRTGHKNYTGRHTREDCQLNVISLLHRSTHTFHSLMRFPNRISNYNINQLSHSILGGVIRYFRIFTGLGLNMSFLGHWISRPIFTRPSLKKY